MVVRRMLPSDQSEAIGPFVFMDHVGPMASPQQSLGAHPHAGIEVITYILEGFNEHRDSLGHTGTTSSGGAQWLTAGRGMLHAERIGIDADRYPVFNAIQMWTKLPRALEDCDPSYRAVQSWEMPTWEGHGASARLIAGRNALFAAEGPVKLKVPALLIDLYLASDHELSLELESINEYGLYIVDGSIRLGSRDFGAGACLTFEHTDAIRLAAPSGHFLRALLLGGARAERPLVYAGSFVFGDDEKAKRAQAAFSSGKMGRLDGVPS